MIDIAGSKGTELVTQTQQWTWDVQDDSGLSSLDVTITHDTGDGPVEIFPAGNIVNAQGAFNFDSFGLGKYEITIEATDNDNEWSDDSMDSTFRQTVVVAPVDEEGIYWWNRSGSGDGFDNVFGSAAESAREVVDAALAFWERVIIDFNYPTAEALLSGNNGGPLPSGSAAGKPVHIAYPQTAGGVAGTDGVLDLGNPRLVKGRRKLPSNLDALLLRDIYGYSIVLPEVFGTMYSTLNESSGELTVQGGFDESDDRISVVRDGSKIVVSVDVGNTVPGMGTTGPYVSYLDASQINSIIILGKAGNDDIQVGAGLDVPVTVDGAGTTWEIDHDTLTILGTESNDQISSD